MGILTCRFSFEQDLLRKNAEFSGFFDRLGGGTCPLFLIRVVQRSSAANTKMQEHYL